MIEGIGIDLQAVDRIRSAVERLGEPFLRRVFTPVELEAAGRGADRLQRLTARFAAKEAVMKALGTGWTGGVGWREIEIENIPGGRPVCRLRGRAAAAAGGGEVLVTLTHLQEYAAACAVLVARG